MAVFPSSFRPEVHGHRGCRGLRPENTLSAFLHAVALGVDVLELDVIVSADGQVVVAHEPWLSPVLGPVPAELALASPEVANLYHLPYATIRECEVGIWPHSQFPEQLSVPGYRPLLAEVIKVVEAACQEAARLPVGYAVEVKSTPAAYGVYQPLPAMFLARVFDVLYRSGVLHRSRLLCFDQRVLQLAYSWHLPVPLCLLTEDATPASVLFDCLGFVPDIFGPIQYTLTASRVAALRAAYPALKLVPWTINEPATMQAMLALQPDGITTDYPDRLLQLLK